MAPIPFFAALGKIIGPSAVKIFGGAATRLGINRLILTSTAKLTARLAPFLR